MATLAEIIYNIKNLRGGGAESDDSKITKRQLEFIINHFRAELAGQKVNHGKALDGFYQELINVKLVSTKDFKAVDRDVIILKSEKRIPSPITRHDNGYVLQYVGLRDDYMGYQSSSVHTFNTDLAHPFIQAVYFVVDEYLYICLKNTSTLREVYVRGVFESPREVLYSLNGENLLLGYDWEYPIPVGTLSQLNALIVNNEYRWMNMLPADIINNGKDDK